MKSCVFLIKAVMFYKDLNIIPKSVALYIPLCLHMQFYIYNVNYYFRLELLIPGYNSLYEVVPCGW